MNWGYFRLSGGAILHPVDFFRGYLNTYNNDCVYVCISVGRVVFLKFTIIIEPVYKTLIALMDFILGTTTPNDNDDDN